MFGGTQHILVECHVERVTSHYYMFIYINNKNLNKTRKSELKSTTCDDIFFLHIFKITSMK